MSNSTGMYEDLIYLRKKHSLDSGFIQALTETPYYAQKYIRSLRNIMYAVCLIFIVFGMGLIIFAFLFPDPKISVLSGMLGAVMLYYCVTDLLKKRKAVIEIERVANYHGLLS